jgi:hypothetical protein
LGQVLFIFNPQAQSKVVVITLFPVFLAVIDLELIFVWLFVRRKVILA